VIGMPSRFLKELPEPALEAPIRWGTELYRAGQGWQTAAPARGGSGSDLAGEIRRIRSFFDKARTVAEEPEPVDVVSPSDLPAGAFAPGTKVRSPRFGTGTVLAATGRGDGLTYTVRFLDAGDKRIVARFGMLERES